MAKVYTVANVEEAVILASKFKDNGEYDWFRGQVKDWPPHSSLFRTRDNKELHSKIDSDYNDFIDWVNTKDNLKDLLQPENKHQLEAILQHYGLPTDYIDFTTEPSIAGFFACDTSSPPIDGYSCIYCLNTDDLLSFWEIIKDFEGREGLEIEKIIVNVDNLWRLQSQYGVFLLASYNWDIDYDMDKIIFPYTGYPSFPTKDIIYPENKSSLEILLDEFFDKQKTINFFQEWAPLFGNNIVYFASLPNGYHKETFEKSGELKSLKSWDSENTKYWKDYKIEDYHITTGSSKKLSLRGKTSEIDIKNTITYAISQMLRSDRLLRTKAINWIIEDLPSDIDSNKICSLLIKIWGGMRLLPFEDEDISIACGNLIYLHLKKVNSLNRTDKLKVFTELFGEGIMVGFSIQEGNGANGFASNESILNSFDHEFSNLLMINLKTVANNPKEIFHSIYNPKLMFDFIKYKTMFAREIIPTQIAMYEKYVIFNPSQIALFGNP